jgi:hypothetical protein
MAKDKKSIIIYCDLIHTVNELSDEEAGKVFKHLLSYVNDLNPEPPDRLTQIVFEPIKQQLKRDLRTWENKKGSRSIAGKIGGLASAEARIKQKQANVEFALKNQAKASKANDVQANQAVSVTDNVNVNVTATVNEIDIKRKETFFSDFPNSSYLESICRDLGKSKDEILSRLSDFRAVSEAEYNSMAEFSTHLKRWINKNPAKKMGGMVW